MLIFAKYKSACHNCGKIIKKGEQCNWIKESKKVYCKNCSDIAQKNNNDDDIGPASGYIESVLESNYYRQY